MNISSHLSVATIETAAANIAAAVSAMTDCVLVRQEIIYRMVSPVAIIGLVGSNKFDCGVFIFDVGTEGEFGLIQVPGFKQAYYVGSGPGEGVLIDIEASDVAAFLDLATEGTFCNPFAQELGGLASAYRESRV